MLNFAQLQRCKCGRPLLQNLPPDSATNILGCWRVDFKLTHRWSFLGWLLICYEKFWRALQKHCFCKVLWMWYIFIYIIIIYFVAAATAILAVLSILVELQIVCICSISCILLSDRNWESGELVVHSCRTRFQKSRLSVVSTWIDDRYVLGFAHTPQFLWHKIIADSSKVLWLRL